LNEVQFDAVFAFKYSPRPNTPAIRIEDSIPEEEKSKRLAVLLDRQRQLQSATYQRHVGEKAQVMVEGRNEARGQIFGRHSQNKTVNFTTSALIHPAVGSYVDVRITKALPNSLVGEMVV
jgi:tRNA-2-methylthio-N6-dimethylallyladenosine synthase